MTDIDKIKLNSEYRALGNPYAVFYDEKLAKEITDSATSALENILAALRVETENTKLIEKTTQLQITHQPDHKLVTTPALTK